MKKLKLKEMKDYYFRIYQFGDEDGDTIHMKGYSPEDAERSIRREYHSIDRLTYLYCK